MRKKLIYLVLALLLILPVWLTAPQPAAAYPGEWQNFRFFYGSPPLTPNPVCWSATGTTGRLTAIVDEAGWYDVRQTLAPQSNPAYVLWTQTGNRWYYPGNYGPANGYPFITWWHWDANSQQGTWPRSIAAGNPTVLWTTSVYQKLSNGSYVKVDTHTYSFTLLDC